MMEVPDRAARKTSRRIVVLRTGCVASASVCRHWGQRECPVASADALMHAGHVTSLFGHKSLGCSELRRRPIANGRFACHAESRVEA